MPALSDNQRAILTARLGAARLGASRLGFLPKDTRGAFYIWARLYKAVTTWTTVRH